MTDVLRGGPDLPRASLPSTDCCTPPPRWEDTLADREDAGVHDDPWGDIFADDEFDDCFRGDQRHLFLLVGFARLL